MTKMQVNKDITIRMLETDDAPEVFKLVDDNRAYLRQWLPWLDTVIDAKDSENFIQKNSQQYADKLGFNGVIVFKNRLVGIADSGVSTHA